MPYSVRAGIPSLSMSLVSLWPGKVCSKEGCELWLTKIVAVTGVAASKLSLPGWLAVMTAEPLELKLRILPLTEATDGWEEV